METQVIRGVHHVNQYKYASYLNAVFLYTSNGFEAFVKQLTLALFHLNLIKVFHSQQITNTYTIHESENIVLIIYKILSFLTQIIIRIIVVG